MTKLIAVATLILLILAGVDGYYQAKKVQLLNNRTPVALAPHFERSASSTPMVVTVTKDSKGMYTYSGTLPAVNGCSAGTQQRVQLFGSKPTHLVIAFNANEAKQTCTSSGSAPSPFKVSVGTPSQPVLEQITLDGSKVEFTLVQK